MDKSDSQVIDEIVKIVIKASRLLSQGHHDKAIDLYTNTLSIHPKRALIYCTRRKLYNDLKQHHASKVDYEVALAIIENNEAEDIRGENAVNTGKAIKQIIQLQEFEITKNHVFEKLESLGLQKFKYRFQDLDKTEEQLASKIHTSYNIILDNNVLTSDEKINKLRLAFTPIDKTNFKAFKKKQFYEIMLKLNQLEVAQHELQAIDPNKWNGCSQELDQVLINRKMSECEQEKIKNYYDGFIFTFSSVFIASQARDNGVLTFKTEAEIMGILTLAISPISGLGEGIDIGLKSIAEIVNDTAIIKRARIMVSIAPDTRLLYQIVVGAACSILMDEGKQKQILNPSKVESGSAKLVFEKIARFSKDNYQLFENRYDKFEKRLGYLDAQYLITNYLSAEIRKPNLQEKFASEVLKSHDIAQLNITQQEQESDGKEKKNVDKNKNEKKKKKGKCFWF